MIPDQVMDAIHVAEFVMAKEKHDRIGSSAATVYPMKFFLFHGQKEITGLLGSPSRHPLLDDKDVMSVLIRLFTLALDAKAVLHVTEAWNATRCAVCGASAAAIGNQECNSCGNTIVPPSQNPYREEILLCTLSIKDNEKAFFWTSRFERDADQKIVGFTDQLSCQPMEASGRFMRMWELESWMAPHFAVNMPVVLTVLGKPVSDRNLQLARVTEEIAPPNFPFLRLNLEDVEAALRRMTIEEN